MADHTKLHLSCSIDVDKPLAMVGICGWATVVCWHLWLATVVDASVVSAIVVGVITVGKTFVGATSHCSQPLMQ